MIRGHLTGEGGLRLAYRRWSPEGKPRGTLAVLHGFGEHGGRYASFAGRLTARGWEVAALDQRGHGRSEGLRGHTPRWDAYREDATAFLRTVAPPPADPVFVMGHSMGSLVALDLGLSGPARLRGVVASGVPLVPRDVGDPWKERAARWLSRLLPRLKLDVGVAPEALSRRPEVVRAYREDPFVIRRATLRWGAEILGAMARLPEEVAGLELPLLVLHGEADRVADVAGARRLSDAAGRRARLRTYPGAFHEPHNDLCADRVASDVDAWMREVAGNP